MSPRSTNTPSSISLTGQLASESVHFSVFDYSSIICFSQSLPFIPTRDGHKYTTNDFLNFTYHRISDSDKMMKMIKKVININDIISSMIRLLPIPDPYQTNTTKITIIALDLFLFKIKYLYIYIHTCLSL